MNIELLYEYLINLLSHGQPLYIKIKSVLTEEYVCLMLSH